MVTPQVLFTLYQKAFFSTLDNHSVLKIEELAKILGNACTDGKKTEVSKASQQMVEGLRFLDITSKMENFEEENSKNPEFQVFNCYVRMVGQRVRRDKETRPQYTVTLHLLPTLLRLQ